MSKTAVFRTLNLSVRWILILNLLLSFVPAPLLHSLGRSSGVKVAHANPIITATKRDVLVMDNDGDGMVDPGDTLRYTVVVTNSGTMDATNVDFIDTIDANTTLVPGLLRTTPIARHDNYASIGNVGITVPAASGLLANDNDPDGTTPTLAIVSTLAGGTANGGAFSIGADGSFAYLPPAGFEGTDTFTYVVQDSDGNQDPAVVFITVTGVIWFIDNTVGAGGNGTLSNPFDSLSDHNLNTIDDNGDTIFIYSGSGSYPGGITLQAGQKLVGQGAGASLASIAGITTVPTHSNTLPATGGTRPIITNSGGSGITLASDNLIRGLAVSNTSGAGIAGSSVDTLTIQEVDVSSTTGIGIHVSDLSGTATLDDLSVIDANADNILIENNTGTATIHLTNSTVNTAGDDGFAVIGRGSANVTLNVTDSSFTHNNSVQLKALADDSSTIDATITGNNFDGDPAVTGNLGVDLVAVDGGTLTFDVIGTLANPQTFQPFRGDAISVFASGGGTATGWVNGNTITGSATGAGISVVAQVTDFNGFNPSITIEIDGNNIDQVEGFGLAGIHIEARDGTSGLTGTADIDATVTNNTVRTTDNVFLPVGGADAAIQVYLSDLNAASTPQNSVCLNATGNATEANGGAFGETDFFFGNDAISGSNSGIAEMQGFTTDVSNTWFTVNGNTTSTSPTPLALGLGPIGGGTCSTVASLLPADSGVMVAQADGATLTPNDSEPTTDLAGVLLAVAGLVESFVARLGDVTAQLVATEFETTPVVASAPNASRRAPGLARTAFAPLASGETINLNLGDLNAGQVVVITFDVTIDNPQNPATNSQVCNQGLFNGSNFANVFTDDPAVGGASDPTCTAIEVSRVDLQVRKVDNGLEAEPGDTIQYTINFTNTGTNTANGVVLTDTVPAGTTFNAGASTAGWNCPSADAGTVCTLPVGTIGPNFAGGSASFVVDVLDPLHSSFDFIVNGVAIGDDGAGGPDQNPADNFSVAITPVDARSDLQVRKVDNGLEAEPGDTIQYTINFTNTGTNTANGVVLTDTVPAGTTFNAGLSTTGWNCPSVDAGTVCTLPVGTIGPNFAGGSASFAVNAVSPASAMQTFIVNGVAIGDDGAGGPDQNPADNFSVAITPVDAAPDLQVSKDDGVGFVSPGGTIQYTIVYTNAGNRNSDSTIISETVPAYTTFDFSNNPDGFDCSPSTGEAGANCTVNVGTVPGNGGGGSVTFSVIVDNPLTPGVTETTNVVDIYGIAATPDANPADNSAQHTTTLNAPPEISGVSLAEQTVQYSDLIATVIISATDPGPDDLTLSATSLPDNLSLSAASCSAATGGGKECTWTLGGQMLEAAGTYNIEVTASDGSLTSDPATITIVVEREEATAAFDDANPVSVLVASDGGDSGPFTLAFDVTEFDDPDDVSGDINLAGNISLADATMTLVPVGPGGSESPTSCAASTGPGLVDPDSPFDYDVLTISCDFDAVPVNTYVVQVSIGGDYYTGADEDVLVVYDPSLGFTTGGGWFYWPGTQDRTNFGYNMKYNKQGKKVQGNLLLIRHLHDGSIYRVKSNALDGLALGDDGTFGWATFSGKSTYLEPGWAEPVGNHTFVAYVEDHGEPGAGADKFWIEVQDKDGNIVTLSMDRAASDNAELLQGGNVVVPHGGGN